jgi:hypothetical protein
MTKEAKEIEEKLFPPIECRAAVEISHITSNEVLFLPVGLHEITPVGGGIGRPIKIKIGPEAAQALEEQRTALNANGKRPYFDFNHQDDAACFWPQSFIWRPGEGVIAKGEWSSRGLTAVEGKDYRAFSPVFHVDNKRANPAKVVCKKLADPNMGGLVNNPAFKDLPLWAKNAGAPAQQTTIPEAARLHGTNKEENKMTTEELAALRAKDQELERDEQDESTATKRAALHSEIKAGELEMELKEIKARNEDLQGKVRKRQLDDARLAVREAVKRGAIAARDLPKQKMWETRIAADPRDKEILDSIPGNMPALGTAIIAGGRVTISDDDPSRIFGELARVSSLSCKTSQPEQRRTLSREFAAIYAREFKGSNKERMLSFPVSEFETAIMGADVTDTNLKTLSGSLVTQRTLELLKFTFPSLTMFTTDFSDQAAQFNQTVITRTVTIPNVTDYNTTTGWADSTAANVDVPVTINKHKGVNLTFNEQIMASTVRRLFDEFAPAAAYALSKQMVDDLYANITDANFTNNSVTATSAFARTSVIDIGTQLTLRGVPLALGQRTLLLYPTVFSKLVADTALITFAAYQKPELITAPQNGASLVIPVDTFQVVNAPNLPTNNGNVTGFGCSKSALVIATRLPNDYTTANPGANYGSVQVMTEPDIGISVMLTQYVNHQLAAATSRVSLMYGTAAGQTNAGQLLKAAAGSGSSRT